MSKRTKDEILFQFDTTLGQASIDGNLMPLMLFSLRRGGSGKQWLFIRLAIIAVCAAVCLTGISTLMLVAGLIAFAVVLDIFSLTNKGLERQMKNCLKFARRQGGSTQDPNSNVRIFFSETEFSVWNPDLEKRLLNFPLDRLFVVESDTLFFITFESKGQRFRKKADNVTTVVRKSAITYGEIGDFRSFLQNYCKSPIKKYAIDYPHVQHIVDEINSITFTATTEKE